MNTTELVMRRRNVAEFIRADPVSVIIVRQLPKVRVAGGGWVRPEVPATLSPQRARIVQSKRRYDAGLVNSEAGEIPDSQLLLIGSHTMDIQKDDQFQVRGHWYTVKGVKAERIESVLAAIDYEGVENA